MKIDNDELDKAINKKDKLLEIKNSNITNY